MRSVSRQVTFPGPIGGSYAVNASTVVARPDVESSKKLGGNVIRVLDHLALHVEDIDEAFQELVAKGVRIRSEPRNFKDLRYCFFYDPDGNSIELLEDPRKAGK